jgi:hypothetical protein
MVAVISKRNGIVCELKAEVAKLKVELDQANQRADENAMRVGVRNEWIDELKTEVSYERERNINNVAASDMEVANLDKQLDAARRDVARWQTLYDNLSAAVTDWRKQVIGNVGSGCPFDALVVLAHRLQQYEVEIERLRAIEDKLPETARWRDKPTVPGLWAIRGRNSMLIRLFQHDIQPNISNDFGPDTTYYGPIPEEDEA